MATLRVSETLRTWWRLRPCCAATLFASGFGQIEAVRGVSFEIAAGETYGLLGPNGAGKTTTISMVCGLLEPDAGRWSSTAPS